MPVARQGNVEQLELFVATMFFFMNAPNQSQCIHVITLTGYLFVEEI